MIKPAVLVIDDEVEVGNFLEYYFRVERGYPVAVANSGREARELLKEKIFDLALVDLKLPDTDGITLLKMIIEVNPVCVVIIMTGYSTVKTAVEAIKLGAFDYVDKPFKDLDELDEIIDRAVNQILNKKSITNENCNYCARENIILQLMFLNLQDAAPTDFRTLHLFNKKNCRGYCQPKNLSGCQQFGGLTNKFPVFF